MPFATLFVPLAFESSLAQAETVENREREAKMACLTGDYKKGVAILSELFVDTKERIYLFNQGRCFEQNGRYEDAILRFREYMRKNRDAGGPPDLDAERHIADCQALMAKGKGETVEASGPGEAKQEALRTTEVVSQPTRTGDRGASLRIAGITAGALGGAALVTGIVFNVKANSLADELESTVDNYRRSKESTRQDYRTYGWVGYGVGAACIMGGAVLYLLGRSQGQTTKVALVPTMSQQSAGLVLQGAF